MDVEHLKMQWKVENCEQLKEIIHTGNKCQVPFKSLERLNTNEKKYQWT